MPPKPSHRLAAAGGLWSAAGFVPFDIWVGAAKVEPPQLLGTYWMLMGIIFLWVPFRFLVAGATIGTFLGGRRAPDNTAGEAAPLAARTATWALSCGASGMLLSLLAIVLGHEGG